MSPSTSLATGEKPVSALVLLVCLAAPRLLSAEPSDSPPAACKLVAHRPAGQGTCEPAGACSLGEEVEFICDLNTYTVLPVAGGAYVWHAEVGSMKSHRLLHITGDGVSMSEPVSIRASLGRLALDRRGRVHVLLPAVRDDGGVAHAVLEGSKWTLERPVRGIWGGIAALDLTPRGWPAVTLHRGPEPARLIYKRKDGWRHEIIRNSHMGNPGVAVSKSSYWAAVWDKDGDRVQLWLHRQGTAPRKLVDLEASEAASYPSALVALSKGTKRARRGHPRVFVAYNTKDHVYYGEASRQPFTPHALGAVAQRDPTRCFAKEALKKCATARCQDVNQGIGGLQLLSGRRGQVWLVYEDKRVEATYQQALVRRPVDPAGDRRPPPYSRCSRRLLDESTTTTLVARRLSGRVPRTIRVPLGDRRLFNAALVNRNIAVASTRLRDRRTVSTLILTAPVKTKSR